MALFLTSPASAFVEGVDVGQVYTTGVHAEFIFGNGQQILPAVPLPIYGTSKSRTVRDTGGFWFEFGFRIDTELAGNPAAGWTDVDNYIRLHLEYSTDLASWALGKFLPTPVNPVINNGDGTWTYWSRCIEPITWANVMVDFRSSSTRYAKSITSVALFNSHISLPRYPYAMPSQSSLLQTDLRAAGYTGALVTSAPAGFSVIAKNHTQTRTLTLNATMSGSSVTAVTTNQGVHIPLPAYPYAMPSAQAALQADLRAAGHTGAVINLHADAWEVLLPDRVTTYSNRAFGITIAPGDPFPTWDFYGNYTGLNAATHVPGAGENIRNQDGPNAPENKRGFARLGISRGTRYDPYH